MSDSVILHEEEEEESASEEAAVEETRVFSSKDRCRRWATNANLLPIFYFCLGFILAMPALALSYFYEEVLHLEPSEMALFNGLQILPWSLKPVYGLISDFFPIMGSHRRNYMSIHCLLAGVLMLVLSFVPVEYWQGRSGYALAMVTFFNYCIAFADVMADTMMVAVVQTEMAEDRGKYQANMFTARHLGAFTGVIVGVFLVSSEEVTQVFLFVSAVPLLLFFYSFSLHDTRSERAVKQIHARMANYAAAGPSCGSRFRATARQIWRDFVERRIWKLALLIVIFASTPSSGAAFFYFLVNELKFEKSEMGVMRIIDSVALILGIVAYRLVFRKCAPRPSFVVALIVSVFLGSIQLILILRVNVGWGVPDLAFAISDDAVLSFVSQIVLMPVYVAAAYSCPAGSEGVMYAGLMSFNNLAVSLSSLVGSQLTQSLGITEVNFDNLWILSIICNATSILPIFMVCWIPRDLNEIKKQYVEQFELVDIEDYEEDDSRVEDGDSLSDKNN